MANSVETTHCTNCKKDVLSTNFMMHDMHCRTNLYLCPKCNEIVNHMRKTDHDNENHATVYCEDCNVQLEKYKLKNHKINECSHRKVKCSICEVEVGINELDEHENYCGSRTEKCSECGEYIMLKYTKLHVDSNHVFIKLSDEPGPSPSWQNGRRTLGNFFPHASMIDSPVESHQRMKTKKSEAAKPQKKASLERTAKINRSLEEWPDLTESHIAYYSRENQMGTARSSNFTGRIKSGDKTGKVSDVDEEDLGDLLSQLNPGKSMHGATGKSPTEANRMRLKSGNSASPSLNHDGSSGCDQSFRFRNRNFSEGEYQNLAQAIESNTAILPGFRFVDALEKNSIASNKSVPQNASTVKKLDKTFSKSLPPRESDENQGKPAEDRLPCELCCSLLPSAALMEHQRKCLEFNVNYFKN